MTTDELIRLFSVLSHDLKSPLFAIDGFADLLVSDSMDKLDEESQDFLLRIRSSAHSMKRILDQMGHTVKLIGKPNSVRAVPLREIIEEVLLKQNFAIEEGQVVVDVPQDLPTVLVDVDKVREMLSAIVSNALFFTDQKSGERNIWFTCESEGDQWRICVRDNGVGIDPRYISQIFDLGGSSKLEKARGGGPGYGLYLAKRVAEAHHGQLTVESALGEGSTFCFTLPRA